MKHIYLDGTPVEVTEEVYAAYWNETEKERYERRKEKKNGVMTFTELGGQEQVEKLLEGSYNLERIIETKEQLRALNDALESLTAEERELVYRIYYTEESLREIARDEKITYQVVQRKRNRILDRLKKILEKDF